MLISQALDIPWRAPRARSYSGRLVQPGEVQAQAGAGPTSPATRAVTAKLVLNLTANSPPFPSSYNSGQRANDPTFVTRPEPSGEVEIGAVSEQVASAGNPRGERHEHRLHPHAAVRTPCGDPAGSPAPEPSPTHGARILIHEQLVAGISQMQSISQMMCEAGVELRDHIDPS